MRKRIIARIDVKNEFAIKGIHLEGLRKVGNPNELARRYYEDGIDEILFMDAVAAYYDRTAIFHIIDAACKNVFVPITVGGGVRTLSNIEQLLRSGADKVSINTQAILNPDFIYQSARTFGSQCIVGSIEAKKTETNQWRTYYDNGRENSQIDVVTWAKRLVELGAGEILLTSIDQEGTMKGFDCELCEIISSSVNVPVITCGGAGTITHLLNLFQSDHISACAVSSILHYNKYSVKELKKQLLEHSIQVRCV